MAYNPKDFYFRKAKEQKFAARSVFKLEEMDKRFNLLRRGDWALDLGCAPGSWSQYASQKVGPSGRVMGIDLARVHLSIENCLFVQGDAFSDVVIQDSLHQWEANEVSDNPSARIRTKPFVFDIVMSDMAPKTTGIRVTDQERSYRLCLRALDVALRYLRPGGHFVVKIFQGDQFQTWISQVKSQFERVEISRPKSVRKESFEIYVLGLRKRGNALQQETSII